MIVIKPADNERKACDAVTRILESRMKVVRTNATCPEKQGDGPPIDYTFDLGSKTYAIEHTRVEAFEKQIHSGIDFSTLVGPIEEALSGQMPNPGVYYLTFPIDPCANIKRKHLPNVREAIIQWVKPAARELHAEAPTREDRTRKPHGHRGIRKAKLEDVPFEVTLVREVHWASSGEHDGTLFVQRWAPNDVEELRRARVKRAFDDKFPKLSDSKSRGANSILILESNDIALTNYALVADAIEAEIVNHENPPDEIFFIDTTIESQWTVWSLLRNGVLLPDVETADRYHEFDPMKLHEV